jgi:hypothetical protein
VKHQRPSSRGDEDGRQVQKRPGGSPDWRVEEDLEDRISNLWISSRSVTSGFLLGKMTA